MSPDPKLREAVADALAIAFDQKPELYNSTLHGDALADDCNRLAHAVLAAVDSHCTQFGVVYTSELRE